MNPPLPRCTLRGVQRHTSKRTLSAADKSGGNQNKLEDQNWNQNKVPAQRAENRTKYRTEVREQRNHSMQTRLGRPVHASTVPYSSCARYLEYPAGQPPSQARRRAFAP